MYIKLSGKANFISIGNDKLFTKLRHPKSYLLPAAIGHALVILLIHAILPSWVNGFPESLNFDLSRLYVNDSDILDTRLGNPELERRPVVALVHKQLNKIIPDQASFNLLQFIFLTLFFYLINLIYRSHRLTLLIVLSFPILFAYMGSIHSYDDILQYSIITLIVAMMIERRFFVSWLLIMIGSIVRETTLIILPVVALYQFLQGNSNRKNAIFSAVLFTTLTLLILYLLSSSKSLDFNISSRFMGWQHNFSTYNRISESLLLPLLVFGLPVAIYLNHRTELTKTNLILSKTIFPLIIINTLIVWIAATSREARLYFMPVLVMLPLIASYIKDDFSIVCNSLVLHWKAASLSFFIAATIALVIYQPTVGGTGLIFRLYAVGYFTVLLFFLWLGFISKPGSITSKFPKETWQP